MPPPGFKPMQTPEAIEDLEFPLFGLDVSTEFNRQRTGTTPVGKNVRAMEPSKLRLRGGSRPGLVKYLPVPMVVAVSPGGIQPIDPDTRVIQHLNIIVDPTTEALSDNFTPPEPTIPDPSSNNGSPPRNPGRRIRTVGRSRRVLPRLSTPTSKKPKQERPKVTPGSGSGNQPNRNTNKAISFVQVAINNLAGIGPWTAAFNSPVKAGNLLVAGFSFFGAIGTPPTISSVTDTVGTVYSLAATATLLDTGLGVSQILAVYYGLAGGTGPNTVTVSGSNDLMALMPLVEYANVRASPLDGVSTNAFAFTGPTFPSMSTGPVTVSTTNDMLLGMFSVFGGNGYAPDAGFTQRNDAGGEASVDVQDKLGTGATAPVTATLSGPALCYLAVGVSFKGK